MDVPGIDDLRAASAVLREAFPDPAGDAGLTALAAEAAALVSMLTGRAIGIEGEGPFGCTLEEVPAPLVPLAVRAVRLRAERMNLLESDAILLRKRAKQTIGGLASISAGPWSESYFKPGETSVTLKALDAEPGIAAELWGLATECVREGWLRLWYPEQLGALEPASAMEEFDWFSSDVYGPYSDPII